MYNVIHRINHYVNINVNVDKCKRINFIEVLSVLLGPREWSFTIPGRSTPILETWAQRDQYLPSFPPGAAGGHRYPGHCSVPGDFSESPRLVAPVLTELLYPPVNLGKAETATFSCMVVNSAFQPCAGHIREVSCIFLNEGKHPGSHSFKTYSAYPWGPKILPKCSAYFKGSSQILTENPGITLNCKRGCPWVLSVFL